jgi:hypothetical protein
MSLSRGMFLEISQCPVGVLILCYFEFVPAVGFARCSKIVFHLLRFVVASCCMRDWPIPCNVAHAVKSFTCRSVQ